MTTLKIYFNMNNNIIIEILENHSVNIYTKLLLIFNLYDKKCKYNIDLIDLLKKLKLNYNKNNIKKINRNLVKLVNDKKIIIFYRKKQRFFKCFYKDSINSYEEQKDAYKCFKLKNKQY